MSAVVWGMGIENLNRIAHDDSLQSLNREHFYLTPDIGLGVS